MWWPYLDNQLPKINKRETVKNDNDQSNFRFLSFISDQVVGT